MISLFIPSSKALEWAIEGENMNFVGEKAVYWRERDDF